MIAFRKKSTARISLPEDKVVVRAFVKLRQMLASNAALTHRLETLERSVSALDTNTRQEFVRVYKAILKLMGPPPPQQ